MFSFLTTKKYKGYNLNQSIEKADYLVLDTELTGLNPKEDSIVSVGSIAMRGTTILLNEVFYRVVSAACAINSEAVIIHGITPDEMNQCPEIDRILPEIMSISKNKILVGHHIGLDIAFLNRALNRLGLKPLDNPAVDTYWIYLWLKKRSIGADAFYEEPERVETLIEIASRYDITVQNVHHSLYDAFVTAQLFQKFIFELKKRGVRTIKELLRISSSERR